MRKKLFANVCIKFYFKFKPRAASSNNERRLTRIAAKSSINPP
jgi:hypothetical protein